MKFRDRPLAITDVETTGLDASVHEIIDLAVLVVDQSSLKILDRYHARVQPEHIRTAAKQALIVAGYNAPAWRNSVSLETALAVYASKATDAVFCSYNSYLAYSFIDAAFKQTGIEDPTDYHRLDLFTLAWTRLGLASPTLDSICKRLEIVPEPLPRRAMDGALKQLEVLKALLYR